MADDTDSYDTESSDDDVFECGRCKQHFTSMEVFMKHKKSKACYKTKGEVIPPTMITSQHGPSVQVMLIDGSAGVHQSFLPTPSTIKPMSVSDTTIVKPPPPPADCLPSMGTVQGVFQQPFETERVFTQIADQLPSAGRRVNSQSALTSQQSILTSQQPALTIQQPALTIQLPALTSQQSTLTSQQPALTSQQSPLTSQQLALTSQQSTLASQQPELTSQQPELTSQQPELTSQQSVLTSQQSTLASQQSPLTSQQPELTSQQSPLTSQQSVLTSQQSTLASQQPALTSQQPALASQESVLTSRPNNNNQGLRRVSGKGGTTDIILAASIASGIEMADLSQDLDNLKHPKAVECTLCCERMFGIDNLVSHYAKIHNIDNNMAILLAKETTLEINKARLAIRRKHVLAKASQKKTPYFCKLCNISFNTGPKLNRHRKTQRHVSKKKQTEASKRNQKKGASVEDPESDNTEEDTYKCAKCNYEALDMDELREHLTSHKKGKAGLLCNQCGIYFTIKGDLEDHMEAAHGKELRRQYRNKKVTCNECGEQIPKRFILSHKRLHARLATEFYCELCKHNAVKQSDYKAHIEFHKTWIPMNLQETAFQNESSYNVVIQAMLNAAGLPDQTITIDGQQETTPQPAAAPINPATIDLATLGLEHVRTMQAAESLTQMCPEAARQTDFQSQIPGKESSSGQRTELAMSEEADMKSDDDAKNTDCDTPSQMNDKIPKSSKLKCRECDTFFERIELAKHMWDKHKMVKQFQCREVTCKYIFTDFNMFCKHVNTSHPNEVMFRCSCRTCLKKDDSDPNYKAVLKKEKMRKYYQQMSYKCLKCWVKFPSQAGLDKHHLKESHNYPCPECSKIHVSKRQLRIHMITHQTERQFLCEKCGQDFKTPRDLHRHSITHSNVKPFQCSFCGKGFSFKNKLHRHMMTVHSGIKPFTCSEQGCTKAFARRDKLTDHQRTHLSFEPFKCEFCQKGFFRKDNLKDHLVLHTGEFRFRCGICQKGFMRPKLLERHKKLEHSSSEVVHVEPQTFMDSGYQLCTIDGQTFNEACQELGMKNITAANPLQIQLKITQFEK